MELETEKEELKKVLKKELLQQDEEKDSFFDQSPEDLGINEKVCVTHPDKEAAGTCTKCGAYICQECKELFTVNDGEYEGGSFCYDCWKKQVQANHDALRANKETIKKRLKFGLVGTVILCCIYIALCLFDRIPLLETIMLTFFFFFCSLPLGLAFASIDLVSKAGTRIAHQKKEFDQRGRSIGNTIHKVLIFALILIAFFMVALLRIFKYPKYLKETEAIIENDEKKMEEINKIIFQSEMCNNNAREKNIDETLKNACMQIAENGEIIRKFEELDQCKSPLLR